MANGCKPLDALSTFKCNRDHMNKIARGQGSEALKIQRKLQDFCPERSEVWMALQTQFSSGVTHSELQSIAEIAYLYSGCRINPVSRAEKRDMRVLVKWFEDNWSTVGPIVKCMRLLDQNHVPINLAREARQVA